ncbi:2-oxoglutarate dependent dioxygenase ftmF [Aspergillus stella-maris]|uniref:2-oxoglutarate dependent dioxygenase ftmF n=1 Tax=Aspergillus stella-maris TaxID=1810926 RepID=UPI003CCCBFF9
MTVSPSKPQIQRLSADADPNAIRQLLEDDGAAILQGVFSDQIIQALNQEIDPAAKAVKCAAKTNYDFQFPYQSKYVFNLPAVSKTFRHDILNNGVLHGIAKSIFQNTGDYWLTAGFLRELHPGHNPQLLHRDESTHPLLCHQKPSGPPLTLSFILALTDFTEDNGGTRVILGSHKWPEIGKPTEDQTVPTQMKAGDVLVLAQGVVHGGGAHPEDLPDPRRAVLVFYSSCQLTQFETHMTMPRELVETMTPLAQQMIGWRSAKPARPNVSGLHITDGQLLENVLGLKANQPLEDTLCSERKGHN